MIQENKVLKQDKENLLERIQRLQLASTSNTTLAQELQSNIQQLQQDKEALQEKLQQQLLHNNSSNKAVALELQGILIVFALQMVVAKF